MNPWFGKLAVLVCLFGFILIRAPHGHRSHSIAIKEDRKGVLEILRLIGAGIGTTLLPVLWVTTRWFARADYALHPAPYALGLLLMLAGLWLFHRSHTDLGTCSTSSALRTKSA